MSVLLVLVTCFFFVYGDYKFVIKINEEARASSNQHAYQNSNQNAPQNPHQHTNVHANGASQAVPVVSSEKVEKPVHDLVFTTPEKISKKSLKSLEGQCFHVLDKEYRYTLCPFRNVTQVSIKPGHFKGSLGSFREWRNQKSFFDDGTPCRSGFKRETTVSFVCGPSYELKTFTEPKSCQYETVLQCPEACIPEAPYSEFQSLVAANPKYFLDTLKTCSLLDSEKHAHDFIACRRFLETIYNAVEMDENQNKVSKDNVKEFGTVSGTNHNIQTLKLSTSSVLPTEASSHSHVLDVTEIKNN